MEAPGFEEHRDGRNGWAIRLADDEVLAFNAMQVERASAWLLGRRTYQIWAAFWPTADVDSEFTRYMNEAPKYVFSNTLKHPGWQNATVLSGDLGQAVRTLKEGRGGDIVIAGSGELVAGLMEHDLIDEYVLQTFPVLLGSGKRLFPEEAAMRHLRLTDSRVFEGGVVANTYVPDHQPRSNALTDMYVWTDEQIRSLHAAEDADRVLATVMFTDIVDSTRRAAELGDRAWRELVERHHRIVRDLLSRSRGTEMDTAGDGFFATFDGPARAVRCGLAAVEQVRPLGIEIRAGVHTGEVETIDGKAGGIAVIIGARIASSAGASEVLVSSTVKDLTAGSGLEFAEAGERELKGVPDPWRVYRATSG
jgi:class 3 adenylate cyclase